MITIDFTQAEAEALEYCVMGVGAADDEDALRTANNKLTDAIEKTFAA